MKTLLLSLLALGAFAPLPALSAQQQRGNETRIRPAAVAAAQNPAQNDQNANDRLLQALYISEFQRQVGVNDEVAGRFRPILMQWLQQRRNVVARRNAAVEGLRRLVASGAPESEISRQMGEVDQAENQTRNADRRLMAQVDPLLTPAQQARFRLFHVDMEQRIRELLEAARQQPVRPNNQPQANRQRANPNANPQRANPNPPNPAQANRQKAPARETGKKTLR